jgi:hypothetical protein
MTKLDEMSFKKPKEIKSYKKYAAQFKTVDNRDNSWRDNMLIPFMASHGFDLAGNGKYGSVFTNEKYNYAIKVFLKDTAYLRFLNWAIRNQHNKYVPKFRGRVVKLSETIFAVRIEKLVDSGNRKVQELVYMLQDWEDVLEGIYDDSTYSIKQSDPDLIEFCKFMRDHAKLVDMHLGNVMSRPNGQPVVVDPLYNWFKSGSFTIDPDNISDLKDLF